MSKQKDVCLQSESRDGRAYQVKARAGHLKELLPILQESKAGPPYQEQKNRIKTKFVSRELLKKHQVIVVHVMFFFLFSLIWGPFFTAFGGNDSWSTSLR